MTNDGALFHLDNALHDLHGLRCAFLSEEGNESFDLVDEARSHINKAIAALEAEPLAVVEGLCFEAEISLYQSRHVTSFPIWRDWPYPEEAAPIPVTVTITPRKVESHA